LLKDASPGLKTPILQFSFYVTRFFLPLKLSYVYPPGLEATAFYKTAAYFTYPALLALLACGFFKKQKFLVFSILFFSISILPVINILRFGLGVPADRYTYLPYISLFFGVVAAAKKFIDFTGSKLIAKSIYCAAAVLFAVLFFYTNSRTALWESQLDLSLYSVQSYTEVNPIPQGILVGELLKDKRYEEARQYCLAFINKNPLDSSSYQSLAMIQSKTGELEEALVNINKAIRFIDNPEKFEMFYIFRARILALLGNENGAIENANRAYGASRNPGIILERANINIYFGNYEKALKDVNSFLKLFPTNRMAYNLIFQIQKELEKSKQPGYAKPYIKRGILSDNAF